MLSVAAHSAYPLSTPGARVRVGEFVGPLSRHGVALSFAPTLTDDEYAKVVSAASPIAKGRTLAVAAARHAKARRSGDLTLVHRLGFLAPIPGVEPPRSLDIYDFDDALYLGSIGKSNRFARPLKNEARTWRTLVRRARLILAGNSHLAAVASREAKGRVEVVPSCVDPSAYRVRKHRQTEVPTVGWVGSRSTSPYLEQVIPALERINRDRVQIRLLVVGGELNLRVPWLEVKPWRLETLAEDLGAMDIGLMPMPQTEWARGKCGYKLLQYFAAGIPAVASPVGVAKALLDGGRGLAASTTDEWEGAIRQLAEDPALRTEMGANGRATVEREYSHKRWAPELARVFKDLVE